MEQSDQRENSLLLNTFKQKLKMYTAMFSDTVSDEHYPVPP